MKYTIVFLMFMLFCPPAFAVLTPARNISVETNTFNKCLGSLDSNVQQALNDIDTCFGEAIGKSIVNVSSNYQIQSSDWLIRSNGTFNDTLPPATGSGTVHNVINIGTGIITVLASGSDVVDTPSGGQSSFVIMYQWSIYSFADSASGHWEII